MTPEDEMVARYRQATGRFTGRIRVGVSLFFALIAGLGVSSQWKEWMLFTHRVDFGQTDPQFHRTSASTSSSCRSCASSSTGCSPGW